MEQCAVIGAFVARVPVYDPCRHAIGACRIPFINQKAYSAVADIQFPGRRADADLGDAGAEQRKPIVRHDAPPLCWDR